MKHYRLREVPLRTRTVEPRGSLWAGWTFWTEGGGALELARPGHPLVHVTMRGVRDLHLVIGPGATNGYSVALPLDFLAEDDDAAASILGIPAPAIRCLYARYDAENIVPRPEA